MADDSDEEEATTEELGRSYAALLAEEGVRTDSPAPPSAGTTGAMPPSPRRILEALLFVGGEPLTAARGCGIVRGLTVPQFDEVIAQLNADYRRQGRPYSIQPREHGWVLALRPRFRHVVTRLYGGIREARLSTAAIDVLALIAYRQPASKAEVDSLRGADSGALLRQLVRRGLIHVSQADAAHPSEIAYGTTQRFLEMFNLFSLDDLPKTHDLQQL